MLSQSGFSWDCASNTIRIESENVWNVYVQAHPDARKYRGKAIENWDDLATICGQDRATGEGAGTGAEANDDVVVNENETPWEETNVHDDSNTPNAIGVGNRQRSGPSSYPPKKKIRSAETLADAMTHVAFSIDKLAESEPVHAPPQKVLDALSEINDLEQSDFLLAYDIMIADGRKFAALSCLPIQLKKSWLLMQIERVKK